jgi:Sulfotransferase family
MAGETPSWAAEPWMLGAANRVAGVIGRFRRPLSADELIETAQRRSGLTDFGDPGFAAALDVLLRSYEAEAELSAFGRLAARWDTMRFLTNLLQLRAAEIQHPEILAEPIVAPIIITGLPRSGTTFLHRLLCEDPANLVVRCWETIYPLPDPDTKPGRVDRRPVRVERQLAGFARLAPELRQLHPLTAQSPQECTEISGHVFQSLRFDTTHRVPSYTRWLDHAGHLGAYRFHKRFLQHLQYRNGPGRWVLKCPDHVFALAALREIYPDARLVFLHRDPLDVLQSVARLTETLRRPFTRRIDRGEIGRQVSERWARGASLLMAAAEAGSSAAEPACHLTFRRFIEDPPRAVAALYEAFGLEFSEALAVRLGRVVAEQANGGYGHNQYRLDEYGLDAGSERRRFRDYTEHFGV